MTFLDVLKSVPGLTHYYPLATDAKDVVGGAHGTAKGGVKFDGKQATFDGTGYIELPDHNDFSVATKGGLTILVFLTITNWKGKGASEYVHWMGKGVGGAHEYTFRHYVQGGSGEAASRQGRISFYHFNPSGGLGAGSYVQEGLPTTEQVITATGDMKQVQMFKNGSRTDVDALSGYSVVPKNTGTPVRIGTRDMSTGFLIGRIRRVAFYNRVLTTAEIQKLYSARAEADGAPTASPSIPTPVPTQPAPTSPAPTAPAPAPAPANVLYPVTGTDVPRGADQLVIYTPASGSATTTNQYGAEATVRGGKVTAVNDRRSSGSTAGTPIPADGAVVSGHGKAGDWVLANMKVGTSWLLPT